MTSPSRKPTVGRIVHYHLDGRPLAALVTAVEGDGDRVALAAFHPDSGLTVVRAEYADEPTPDHWSWPPLV